MSLAPILFSAGLAAFSGMPGLAMKKRAGTGQWLATVLMIAAAAVGLPIAIMNLASGTTSAIDTAWMLPIGRFAIGLDAVSAIFLVPVLIIPVLGSIYGMGYWRQNEHPTNAQKLRLFYGLLTASMMLVVLARDGVLFLIAWEVMAISAFFLITTEDHDSSVRQSGWIYLVATHLGALCLIAMFGLLAKTAGSFSLAPAAIGALPNDTKTAVFMLALVGFGLKAGLMPLHIWLPGAHANAPSHVSAMLSGVMLKMGVYGIVRMISILPLPPMIA